jgi:hypothetical protein
VRDTDVMLHCGTSIESMAACFDEAKRRSMGLRELALRIEHDQAQHREGSFEPVRLRLLVQIVEEDKTVRQRGFYHAAVLKQISEQARVNGVGYTAEVWKEFFRKRFLPDTWVSMRLPGAKRATPVRQRSSTEDLGIRGYSELIDQVIAAATTELGVEFVFDADERETVRVWSRHERNNHAQPR